MHYTARLLQNPGFVRRSLQEASRIASFVAKFEGITGPTKPLPLIDFSRPEAIFECKTMSDADMEGFSTVSLTHVIPPPTFKNPSLSQPSSAAATPRSRLEPEDNEPPSELQSKLRSEFWSESSSSGPESSWASTSTSSSSNSTSTREDPPHARLSGSISTKLPPNRPEIMRTGYAGFRTIDRAPTIFGSSDFDMDAYSALALRIKSDGRSYFVNIQTDSIVPTDIHQHRLFASEPGRWETVLIELADFVRTNHGMVVEPQGEMRKGKVRSVGISSIDRVTGPYELCVSGIWAVNETDDLTQFEGEREGSKQKMDAENM